MHWGSGEDAFVKALSRIPDGYSEGAYKGSRWGATVKRSADGKRIWLYAEDLSGTDIVSFNLYALNRKRVLKPCEMSCAKVAAFVLQYRPDALP
jgi:hypothetical protein